MSADGQYFDASPSVTSRPGRVQLALPDLSCWLTTDRGVFSGDRIDPGTRLLLLEAPPPPADGSLLDLGCGYGPIAVTMAQRSPSAQVWAVDVNERARDLCRANTASFPTVHVAAPDEVPDDTRFALIWSNPPIRIGKAALHEMLDHWLHRLTPDGSAVLVVQRHLGADSLADWLRDELGCTVQRLASRQAYRLLHVSPPTRVRITPHGRAERTQPEGGS